MQDDFLKPNSLMRSHCKLQLNHPPFYPHNVKYYIAVIHSKKIKSVEMSTASVSTSTVGSRTASKVAILELSKRHIFQYMQIPTSKQTFKKKKQIVKHYKIW